MGQVREVSQTEEKQEDSNVERALSFLRGLSSYFEEDPRRVISLLDDLTEDLMETVGYTDLGVAIGQVRALAHLLWATDSERVVKRVVSDPEGLADIIEALTQLTTAYNLLKNNKADDSYIRDLINKAVEALKDILRGVIAFADYCDP
jgi:hypothetical protein